VKCVRRSVAKDVRGRYGEMTNSGWGIVRGVSYTGVE
jgi:hypothetical protein